MSLLERLRQRHRRVGNHDAVQRIGHEAVTPQGQTIKLRLLSQQRQVGKAIGIVGENNLSGISPLRNLMGNIRDDDAGESSHNSKYAGGCRRGVGF
jgi:ABC-type polysaccharide/polyol phosphate transport system ATPase subunit